MVRETVKLIIVEKKEIIKKKIQFTVKCGFCDYTWNPRLKDFPKSYPKRCVRCGGFLELDQESLKTVLDKCEENKL